MKNAGVPCVVRASPRQDLFRTHASGCTVEKARYSPRMHADTIKEHLHAQPFQPFTVHTVSGESYLIDHPDFASLSRGGRTITINPPGGEGERVRVLDTALIERLEKAELPQSN